VLKFAYHQDFPGLLAASGVVSIILGFALQDSLGNIIGGFAIQVGRPFQVGDWLLVDNQSAQATEINWRSTRFVTNDEVQLDVPNQQIVRGIIVNYHGGSSRHGMRLEVGIQSDAPPNRVRDVLFHATAASHGVLKDPPPNIFLKQFGDSANVYEVRYWIDNHRNINIISDSIRTNIWYALRRQHIHMPFPTRTLHLERARHGHAPADLRRDPHEAVCDLLRQQGLFKSMSAEHLKLLVTRCPMQHYGTGETIIREGADGASMFVLVGGEAAVSVSTGGEPTRVATLRGGDCFGEMSLLTGETRSASVNALTDCEVMEITKSVFGDAIQRDPELLTRLSELLARRQMQTDKIVEAHAQQPASTAAATEQEYQEGFLHTIKSFFEL
jgi:CRP-like cAMP-binding protein